jgi:pyruvate/2-oxoacid:ferredoxin oxidoreductase beta subunit
MLFFRRESQGFYYHAKDSTPCITGRRWSQRYYIETDKYNVTILISPINKAGQLSIKNKLLLNNQINEQLKEKQEQIKKLEEDISELKNQNELPEGTKKVIDKLIKIKEIELEELKK